VPGDTRKVSAIIPAQEHAAIKKLVAQHGTTIECLIGFGLRLVFRELKNDKRAVKKLRLDPRTVAGKKQQRRNTNGNHTGHTSADARSV